MDQEPFRPSFKKPTNNPESDPTKMAEGNTPKPVAGKSIPFPFAPQQEEEASEQFPFPPPKPKSEPATSGGFEIDPNTSNLPPLVAKALFKNKERLKKLSALDEEDQEKQENEGPRLAFTGDDKLDSLLAGIKEQSFNYEEILLPSLGRFYDGSQAPTNGVLHVRPMTGNEQEILATPRLIKKGQAVNMIFRACVRESIKPEQLLTVDRTVLLIYLRGISYGSDYEVEVRCPACSTKFNTVIDLDKPVAPIPSDINSDSLTETLPVTGYRFTYRLATGKDDQMISEYRERRIKKFGDQSHDDTFAFRASLLVSSIEDPRSAVRVTDQQHIKVLLNKLPMADVTVIQNSINDPGFGLETKCQMSCPSCTEDFEIELPMESSFFYPQRKKKQQKNIPV